MYAWQLIKLHRLASVVFAWTISNSPDHVYMIVCPLFLGQGQAIEIVLVLCALAVWHGGSNIGGHGLLPRHRPLPKTS